MVENQPTLGRVAAELHNVSVTSGETQTLVDVSLRLEHAKAYGLAGDAEACAAVPSVLRGERQPTAGSVRVFCDAHFAAWSAFDVKVVGMIVNAHLNQKTKIGRLLGKMPSIYHNWDRACAEEAVRLVGLHQDARLYALSREEKVLLQAVIQIARRPALLLLDLVDLRLGEAALTGLKRAVVSATCDCRSTIVFTARTWAEARALADVLVVMDRGRVVYCGSDPWADEVAEALRRGDEVCPDAIQDVKRAADDASPRPVETLATTPAPPADWFLDGYGRVCLNPHAVAKIRRQAKKLSRHAERPSRPENRIDGLDDDLKAEIRRRAERLCRRAERLSLTVPSALAELAKR